MPTSSRGQPSDVLLQKKYVPFGLTDVEYKQIQDAEAAKKASMNYGAFGPRFSRVSRPRGDWLLAPNLWTRGIVSSLDPKESDNGTLGARGGKFKPLATLLVAYAALSTVALVVKLFAARLWSPSSRLSISRTSYAFIELIAAGLWTTAYEARRRSNTVCAIRRSAIRLAATLVWGALVSVTLLR